MPKYKREESHRDTKLRLLGLPPPPPPPAGKQVYADVDHDSSVTHYEIKPGGMNVTFGNRDGSSKTFHYADPGHVANMIPLAVAGEDLNRYINLNKPVYSVEASAEVPTTEVPTKRTRRKDDGRKRPKGRRGRRRK